MLRRRRRAPFAKAGWAAPQRADCRTRVAPKQDGQHARFPVESKEGRDLTLIGLKEPRDTRRPWLWAGRSQASPGLRWGPSPRPLTDSANRAEQKQSRRGTNGDRGAVLRDGSLGREKPGRARAGGLRGGSPTQRLCTAVWPQAVVGTKTAPALSWHRCPSPSLTEGLH